MDELLGVVIVTLPWAGIAFAIVMMLASANSKATHEVHPDAAMTAFTAWVLPPPAVTSDQIVYRTVPYVVPYQRVKRKRHRLKGPHDYSFYAPDAIDYVCEYCGQGVESERDTCKHCGAPA